jgi:hypothetical protein
MPSCVPTYGQFRSRASEGLEALTTTELNASVGILEKKDEVRTEMVVDELRSVHGPSA